MYESDFISENPLEIEQKGDAITGIQDEDTKKALSSFLVGVFVVQRKQNAAAWLGEEGSRAYVYQVTRDIEKVSHRRRSCLCIYVIRDARIFTAVAIRNWILTIDLPLLLQ